MEGGPKHIPYQKASPRSKYHSVDVRLLHWAEDDLGVLKEIVALEKIFKDKCNFATQRFSIPSHDSEWELIQEIQRFRRDKTAHDLLILYYGGHAEGHKEECKWAANMKPDSPQLLWHGVQGYLTNSDANVLIILDCCFSSLAARSHTTGNNWFFGASSKTEFAAGVSPFSFTSALTRQLEQHAHLYWEHGTPFNVQSINRSLQVHEENLEFTPNAVPLSHNEDHPPELTPLPAKVEKPALKTVNSDPPQKGPAMALGSLGPKKPSHVTLPSGCPPSMIGEDNDSDPRSQTGVLIQLSSKESQTIRITGLPPWVSKSEIEEWVEVKLSRRSMCARVGPLVKSSSRVTTTLTLPNVALAKQALAISDKSYLSGGQRFLVTIENEFDGLTCLYKPRQEPTLDIFLVHGSSGHAVNSFASHYAEPSREICWPRDELPRHLEAKSIFPRIMTIGWDADVWFRPPKSIDSPWDNMQKEFQEARFGCANRPIAFIGHGLGGLFIKQIVAGITLGGLDTQNFENPIRACFFFAVPHHGKNGTSDYAEMLAKMQALSHNGIELGETTRRLRSRDRAIHSLSEDFAGWKKECNIACASFHEDDTTGGNPIVPKVAALLETVPGAGHAVAAEFLNIVRPYQPSHVEQVTNIICNTLAVRLGLQSKGEWYDLLDVRQTNTSVETQGTQKSDQELEEKAKERVFGWLRRYDTKFLVDDSDSMGSGTRWTTTKKVLAKIAEIAVKYDGDGVDIRFFNSHFQKEERTNLKTTKEVMDLFKTVELQGPTMTEALLDEELGNYMERYKEDREIKGLNLIVLTDGEPDDDQEVDRVVINYANELKAKRAPKLQVGIQFVQIGGDEKATKFLKWLDDDLQKDKNLDRDVSHSRNATCMIANRY